MIRNGQLVRNSGLTNEKFWKNQVTYDKKWITCDKKRTTYEKFWTKIYKIVQNLSQVRIINQP